MLTRLVEFSAPLRRRSARRAAFCPYITSCLQAVTAKPGVAGYAATSFGDPQTKPIISRAQASLILKDGSLFQTTGRATGLFANVDKTRRPGFESALNGSIARLDWFLAYSYLEATLEDDFTVLSPNHPFASDEGDIAVSKGDRIPGLPKHALKLGADYALNEKLSIGFDLRYNSKQVLRGDESNQVDKLDGYAVVNLRGCYRVWDGRYPRTLTR